MRGREMGERALAAGSVANKAGRQKNLHRLPSSATTAINWMSDLKPLISRKGICIHLLPCDRKHLVSTSTTQDSPSLLFQRRTGEGESIYQSDSVEMKSENVARTWPSRIVSKIDSLISFLFSHVRERRADGCDMCDLSRQHHHVSGITNLVSRYLVKVHWYRIDPSRSCGCW